MNATTTTSIVPEFLLMDEPLPFIYHLSTAELAAWVRAAVVTRQIFKDTKQTWGYYDDLSEWLVPALVEWRKRLFSAFNLRQRRIDSNEDAEYEAEWNLYGEADIWDCDYLLSDVIPHTVFWPLTLPYYLFCIEEYLDEDGDQYQYAAYRRYPLIDAARIEAQ